LRRLKPWHRQGERSTELNPKSPQTQKPKVIFSGCAIFRSATAAFGIISSHRPSSMNLFERRKVMQRYIRIVALLKLAIAICLATAVGMSSICLEANATDPNQLRAQVEAAQKELLRMQRELADAERIAEREAIRRRQAAYARSLITPTDPTHGGVRDVSDLLRYIEAMEDCDKNPFDVCDFGELLKLEQRAGITSSGPGAASAVDDAASAADGAIDNVAGTAAGAVDNVAGTAAGAVDNVAGTTAGATARRGFLRRILNAIGFTGLLLGPVGEVLGNPTALGSDDMLYKVEWPCVKGCFYKFSHVTLLPDVQAEHTTNTFQDLFGATPQTSCHYSCRIRYQLKGSNTSPGNLSGGIAAPGGFQCLSQPVPITTRDTCPQLHSEVVDGAFRVDGKWNDDQCYNYAVRLKSCENLVADMARKNNGPLEAVLPAQSCSCTVAPGSRPQPGSQPLTPGPGSNIAAAPTA
jgi:hypothetical protein